MASNLTTQVRNIAAVTTAVATGDLSKKITVDVKGEILELKDTVNTMVDQLSSFADEVTRVAREVGMRLLPESRRPLDFFFRRICKKHARFLRNATRGGFSPTIPTA